MRFKYFGKKNGLRFQTVPGNVKKYKVFWQKMMCAFKWCLEIGKKLYALSNRA